MIHLLSCLLVFIGTHSTFRCKQAERFQPGSGDLVLANKLDITETAEMDALELEPLLMLYEQLFIRHQLLATLIFEYIHEWHRKWLGNVKDWAEKFCNQTATRGMVNGY